MRFIFGEGTDTPDAESLRRRRDIADRLAAQAVGRTPRNIGEGLSAVGQALAARFADRRLGPMEAAERERLTRELNEAQARLMGGFGGMPPASGSIVPTAGTPTPPAPTPVNVAETATTPDALDMGQSTLIGTVGSGNNITALVRTPSGEVIRAPARPEGDMFNVEGYGVAAVQSPFAAVPDVGRPPSVFNPPATPAPAPAPVAPAPAPTASAAPANYMQPFMDTVRAGGVTNPYALAAIAATGQRESGFSPANATRTWSDPSESGQPGTSGGIMSWRGPRLAAMQEFTGGDLSPEMQAQFFLQENPQLVAQLNAAGSVEEAAALMADAWRFAGYNRPGGEAAARVNAATELLPMFANGQPLPQGAAPAVATGGGNAPVVPVGGSGGAQGGMAATVAQLSQIIGNPYATDGQRAVAQALLTQQMQAADPLRQLQLERAQLELEALQNPQSTVAPDYVVIDGQLVDRNAPGGPSVVQVQGLSQDEAPRPLTAEERAAWGIPENDTRPYALGQNGLPQVIGAGGDTFNFNTGSEVGTIPQGYELFTDPETGARSLRPIPGGPEDTTESDVNQAGMAETRTDVVLDAALSAFGAAQERTIGGRYGQMIGNPQGNLYMPGTPNAEIYRQIETLRSLGRLETLQAMREASPTGGAMGNLSDGEGRALEVAIGALDPGAPTFERDLARVTRNLLRTIHGPEAGDAMFAETPLAAILEESPRPTGNDRRTDRTGAAPIVTHRYNPATGQIEAVE